MGDEQTPPHLKPVGSPSENDRIWSALQEMNKQLLDINKKFAEVIRLDERVNFHNETLSRYGLTLERHERALTDARVHLSELSRTDVADDILRLKKDVRDLRQKHSDSAGGSRYSDGFSAGRRQMTNGILKVIGTLAAGFILYTLTSDSEGAPPDIETPLGDRHPPAAIRKKEDIWP